MYECVSMRLSANAPGTAQACLYAINRRVSMRISANAPGTCFFCVALLGFGVSMRLSANAPGTRNGGNTVAKLMSQCASAPMHPGLLRASYRGTGIPVSMRLSANAPGTKSRFGTILRGFVSMRLSANAPGTGNMEEEHHVKKGLNAPQRQCTRDPGSILRFFYPTMSPPQCQGEGWRHMAGCGF